MMTVTPSVIAGTLGYYPPGVIPGASPRYYEDPLWRSLVRGEPEHRRYVVTQGVTQGIIYGLATFMASMPLLFALERHEYLAVRRSLSRLHSRVPALVEDLALYGGPSAWWARRWLTMVPKRPANVKRRFVAPPLPPSWRLVSSRVPRVLGFIPKGLWTWLDRQFDQLRLTPRVAKTLALASSANALAAAIPSGIGSGILAAWTAHGGLTLKKTKGEPERPA
jgi:hypothetical protein